MKHWEYMALHQSFSDNENIFVAEIEGRETFMMELNALGSDGWELVCINDRIAILKRELPKARDTSLF